MLSRLSITNYALIEHLDLEPGDGLSIITGETGAGKSIMLGALSLLRGDRADMKVIADKNRKAVVEAVFTGLDDTVSAKILANEPDWDGNELIIRREIHPSGRSRAFINDSPATLALLQDVARGLLDIHSQNSNSLLSEQHTQLRLLDSIASNGSLIEDYVGLFNRYASLRQQIRRVKEEEAKNREHAEIIAFRLGQLDKLKPKAGELRKIESRYETLCNSEEIRNSLIRARKALDGGEMPGALEQIDTTRSALDNVDFAVWEEQDPHVADRLHQCAVELKDILELVDDAIGLMEFDPSTMESLSTRMRDYYNAFKVFRTESDAELEEQHALLRKQFQTIESGESSTAQIEREARSIAAVLKKKAAEISERRREGARLLQLEVVREARKLGLENINFEIRLEDTKLSRTGGDSVEFLVAFNKNGVSAPVGDVASGGEAARLMLAIKKISAARLSLPTIIFDEIDTGVSGSIADRMGEMMMQMGSMMQILTITHLPQVAVKGERHFKVYKEDRGDKTVSDVMLLSDAQREEEIGRMLSGEKLDDAALTNARSLLKKK